MEEGERESGKRRAVLREGERESQMTDIIGEEQDTMTDRQKDIERERERARARERERERESKRVRGRESVKEGVCLVDWFLNALVNN